MPKGRRPPAELARAYLKHHRTQAKGDFWAFEEVGDRVTSDDAAPEDAWAVVLALVVEADEDSLGYVGAGPLEDFVRRVGTAFIDQIEAESRRDPKFHRCLGRVWLSHGDLPPAILSRVVTASGHAIRPLGTRET